MGILLGDWALCDSFGSEKSNLKLTWQRKGIINIRAVGALHDVCTNSFMHLLEKLHPAQEYFLIIHFLKIVQIMSTRIYQGGYKSARVGKIGSEAPIKSNPQM